jgi:transcriptional regulator with XRE-family HTH domain
MTSPIKRENRKQALKDFYEELGSNLKNIRISLNLRLSDIAKNLGITKQELEQFESGKVRIHVFFLNKLLNLYDISFNEILPKSTTTPIKKSEEDAKELAIYFKGLTIQLHNIIKKQTQIIKILNNDLISIAEPISNNYQRYKEAHLSSQEIKDNLHELSNKENSLSFGANDDLQQNNSFNEEVKNIEAQISLTLDKLEPHKKNNEVKSAS